MTAKTPKVEKSSNDNYFETRLALLEQSIGHINESLIKIDKRFDIIDRKFDYLEIKIGRLDEKFDSKINSLNAKIDSGFRWHLNFTIGGFIAILGVMARGFHWY